MGAEDHRFPCNNCGSDLRFDPGADQLACDHCGSVESIDHGPWDRTEAIEELDFRATLRATRNDVEMEEARTSQCPNCGARIEFDDAVHAKECPYCATPVVTDTGATRQIKPRAVVPFELSEQEARQAM
ncbi:MAG: primosomal protein N' (replication factor Y) - superfamily II helicase, partial [Boseongicola sp.]|nr:primosomal protein N' (replication factor Y) - superfamily II helicase [Boseongicola sp.]